MVVRVVSCHDALSLSKTPKFNRECCCLPVPQLFNFAFMIDSVVLAPCIEKACFSLPSGERQRKRARSGRPLAVLSRWRFFRAARKQGVSRRSCTSERENTIFTGSSKGLAYSFPAWQEKQAFNKILRQAEPGVILSASGGANFVRQYPPNSQLGEMGDQGGL